MHSHTKETKEKENTFFPKGVDAASFCSSSSCSRSPPACPSSMCHARSGVCGQVPRRAWPLSLALVPSRGTHQPCGQGCCSLPCCLMRRIAMLMCSTGGVGGVGRQNPQHGPVGASALVGGFERGLGTARKSNRSGRYGASLIFGGARGYDNNHNVLLSIPLLQFLKGLGGGRINKYLHYSKGKKGFTYYSSQVYTTEGVRHKFTCGRKQAIHRYIPTKNPCDKTIIYAW